MASPIGQVIANRYALLDLIGSGGQGSVYRARDLEQQRLVAVKMLSATLARDAEYAERLAREQQAMVALSGTHAVGFVDFCTAQNGTLCLVMELLDGVDLETHLDALEEKGRFMPPTELRELLEPIVETLHRAHAVGIVHRDVKPANIFLLSAATGGGVRLLDFGLARTKNSRKVTALGTIVGSPSYIAPELWRGETERADHRIDVYSLSVIIFRALSGRLPFEGLTLRDKYLQATTAERPSLRALRPALPAAVDSWVQRALAVDPDERFKSVRSLWHELMAALDLEPFPEAPATDAFDFSRIRAWLQTPLSALPNTLTAAWRTAALALRRLSGDAPARGFESKAEDADDSDVSSRLALLPPPIAILPERRLPPPPRPPSSQALPKREPEPTLDLTDDLEELSASELPAPAAPTVASPAVERKQRVALSKKAKSETPGREKKPKPRKAKPKPVKRNAKKQVKKQTTSSRNKHSTDSSAKNQRTRKKAPARKKRKA